MVDNIAIMLVDRDDICVVDIAVICNVVNTFICKVYNNESALIWDVVNIIDISKVVNAIIWDVNNEPILSGDIIDNCAVDNTVEIS